MGNHLLGMQLGVPRDKDSHQFNQVESGALHWFIEWNIRQIALQHARWWPAGGEREAANAAEEPRRAAANNIVMMVRLMPMPRSLHDLWQEYHHSVGGKKPLDSYTERGHSYYWPSRQCKVIWDLVSSLVWMGDTAETTIDKIYPVYGGQTSVTNIMNGLKRVKRDVTLNPNSRI